MPERNTPQKTLESWKQIAAYLDRSERTVRRWEVSEGLPVHRREHQKQDTVFAFKHEIEAWSRLRTKCPEPLSVDEPDSLPAPKPPANAYLAEHDAITRTMHCYIAGARAGDSDLMRPAFHPAATISGYCQGVEYTGSVEHVFRWIDENGPASTSILGLHASRLSRVSPWFILKYNTGRVSWQEPMPVLLMYSLC